MVEDSHIAILDEDGTIIATNRAQDPVPEAEHVTPGDSLHQLLAPGVDEETSREVHEAIQRLLNGGQTTYETEYAWEGGNGERWFHLVATRFEFEARSRIAITHRDVTDRQAARMERQALQEQYTEEDLLLQKLAENLPQALWVVDGDLQEVDFMSPRAAEIWGLPLEDLKEDPLAWMQVMHEDDRERVQNLIPGLLESARVDPTIVPEFKLRIRHPSKGEVRWIRVQGVPIHEQGELSQIVGIVEDITSQREEARQEHRRTRALARSTELEQLLFATSHSLQTHIRQAVSFSQLLERQHANALPPEANELLDNIVTSVRELETLHEALNRYANITDDDNPHAPVNLNTILEKAKTRLAKKLEAANATVHAEELPTVQGDARHLAELFTELLQNAVQFRSEDPLNVTVRAEQDASLWRIEVTDNGQGFDPKYSDGLFRPFRQLDPGRGNEQVGIGLTICRRIVENHDGTINAHANPDQGATVRFMLPAANQLDITRP